MRGHGTALAHLLFLAARRRPHEFGLHGCLLRSHPLTLPTAPISFNFLAVNDIALLAAGWGARQPALGLRGSDQSPHQGDRATQNPTGDPRTYPARTCAATHLRWCAARGEGLCRSGSRTSLYPGTGALSAGGGNAATLLGSAGINSM